MNALPQIVESNTKQAILELLESNPMTTISSPEDVFSAPNYSGINTKKLCKILKAVELQTYFVDSSGFGTDHEPALSKERFTREIERLIDDHGKYCLLPFISSVGQFQVYITVLKAL